MAGKVVILSAPSGSGKTTLARYLLSVEKLNFKFSVSATTRKKREGEIHGKDYHFLSLNEFKNKIINIHPSLLPKYGGRGMYGVKVHEKVIENEEKETGFTIHYVDKNYDEGDIIFQKKLMQK